MSNKPKHKSKKLTNFLRNKIVSEICKDIFAKKETKYKKDEMAFYDLCYRTRYTPAQIRDMFEFPDSRKAFKYSRYISNHFGGYASYNKSMSESRPFWEKEPDNITHWSSDCAITKKWHELNKQYDDLQDKKNNLSREIRSVLRPCNTTNQLISAWPEAEYWLERIRAFDEPAPVPMKSPEKLNTLIFTLINFHS